MAVSVATEQDIPVIVNLANSAYRGETSKKGWTTEAHLLEGNLRTDIAGVTAMMNDANAVFLTYTNAANEIAGCVYLKKNNSKLYLGLLSVSPEQQAGGIGKQLLKAAELHAKEKNCNVIYMTVISARTELIAWYVRHGYKPTGETEPFPTDNRFGVPTQHLEFIVLEKEIL